MAQHAKERRLRMAKNRFLVALIIIWATFTLGCDIETAEIHGLVLNAVTKEPIAEGWILASIGISAKTVAGDVGRVVSVEPPHLRTDKNGRFVIPSKVIKMPSFPSVFGVKVDDLIITVWTTERRGVIELGEDKLRGKKLEVIIYAEDIEELVKKELANVPPERYEERKLRSEFSGLQSLYNYCQTGRFGIEVPAVKGGCDEWELNYAIEKHERLLKKLGGLNTIDKRNYYVITLIDVGYLYKKKGDYKRALEIFIEAKEFDEKRKVKLYIREYEMQIEELNELLKNQNQH